MVYVKDCGIKYCNCFPHFEFYSVDFFEPTYSEMQFVEKAVWIKDFGINYFQVDGVSIFFLPLTS